MDDEQAHYLILVGNLCQGAAEAGLPVYLEMAGGDLVSGVPQPRTTNDADEVDETGWASTIRFETSAVRLERVVSCAMRAPRPEQARRSEDDPETPAGS